MTTARLEYPQLKDKYNRLRQIGEGSFGKVYIGQINQQKNNQNSNSCNQNYGGNNQKSQKRYVALKKLKPYNRKKQQSPIQFIEDFPEVELMQKMHHPNILELREIRQVASSYETRHYMVLDLGIELMELTKHKEIMLSAQQIRCLIAQLASALSYLHRQGIMHRDLKPSNIYLMPDGNLKLGDFSIARRINSENIPPTNSLQASLQKEMTSACSEKTGNITTRQYRAPQIIYGSKNYDESIDIWGLGCTIAELVLGQCLFPGTSDIHQLELIFRILGSPQEHWPQAAELPFYLQFATSEPAVGLTSLIPSADPRLVCLLQGMLALNPKKRISLQQISKSDYVCDFSQNAQKQLGKVCSYLHEKRLKELLK